MLLPISAIWQNSWWQNRAKNKMAEGCFGIEKRAFAICKSPFLLHLFILEIYLCVIVAALQ